MGISQLPFKILRADRGDVGERLDLVLQRHLAGVPWASRTKIQSWLKEGAVLVNGLARKPSHRAAAGDEITVNVLPPPEPEREIVAQDIPLSVLYEDDHLLAIDKPPGLVVHPAVGHRDGTLVNALLFRSREWAGPEDRPGLVHRLDKDTSGVLLVAKTEEALSGIGSAMLKRTIEKEYLCVVYGRTPVTKGRVDLGILRDPRDRKKMTTSKTEGRASSTLYERLGESVGKKEGVSFLRCTLLTGRTHQIRVHLKALNLPIVGDVTYGSARWKGIQDAGLAAACADFRRQALHAWRLAFTHPVTKQRVSIVAPVPDDLAKLLEAAGIDARLPDPAVYGPDNPAPIAAPRPRQQKGRP